MPFAARRHAPRPALLAVAAAVAVTVLGVQPAPAAAADLTVPAAEAEVLRLLNVERQKVGVIALRLDSRLASIARARSADMATKGYFSHTQPDGRNVFDLFADASVKWSAAGEIIAWNNWPTLADSAVKARDSWMGSSPHRSIILSRSYNYFGIGLALDPASGKRLWTGVFIKGPDRTGGWVSYLPVAGPPPSTASNRTVTISWRGGDIQLATNTSGLRHYQTQVRTDAAAWKWLSTATLATGRSLRLWRGHSYTFRTRACDRAGNCGSWYNLALAG